MNRDLIPTIILGAIAILSILSMLLETKVEPQPQIDLKGIAEIIKATQQPITPSIINRVNSDDNSPNKNNQVKSDCDTDNTDDTDLDETS